MYSGTAGEMNYYGVSKLSGDMRNTEFIVENSPAFQDAPEWGALYKKTLSVRAHRL